MAHRSVSEARATFSCADLSISVRLDFRGEVAERLKAAVC